MMRFKPDFSDKCYIHYSRKDGLRDGALIPVENYLYDTSGTWERGDEKTTFDSLKNLENESDIRPAINTSLETNASEEILAKALKKFNELKTTEFNSKCLVVAKSIHMAKQIYSLVSKRYKSAAIATSADPKAAEEAIYNFKYEDTDILITCQLAYEGLDCKAINVICLLTNIRSKPWIEQAIGRGTRFDPDGVPDQKCHLFTLQDKLLEEVLRRIRDDELEAAREIEETSTEFSSKVSNFSHLLPLRSKLKGFKWADFDTGQDLAASTLQASVRKVVGAEITTDQATEIFLSLQPSSREVSPPLSPAELNKKLRHELKKETCRYAYDTNQTPEEVNRAIKLRYGKPRDRMNNEELKTVLNELTSI